MLLPTPPRPPPTASTWRTVRGAVAPSASEGGGGMLLRGSMPTRGLPHIRERGGYFRKPGWRSAAFPCPSHSVLHGRAPPWAGASIGRALPSEDWLRIIG